MLFSIKLFNLNLPERSNTKNNHDSSSRELEVTSERNISQLT